jgi:hypothetical protein
MSWANKCYVRECDLAPTHTWKKLQLCCSHYSWLLETMYEMNMAVAERRYQDMLDIYKESAARMEKSFGIKMKTPKEGE